MVKELQGVYDNLDEAVAKVESLNERGYEEKDITILANREVEKDLPWNVNAEVSTSSDRKTDEDKSLWESIKSAFVVDDNDEYNTRELADIRETHRADLDAGKILVLVDSNADVHRGDYNNNENFTEDRAVTPGMTTTREANEAVEPSEVDRTTGDFNRYDNDRDHRHDDRHHTDSETLELKEEKVNIDKEERDTGDVEVNKRVVEETQTVDVPIKREEVTIKRKPAHGKTTKDGISDVGEEEIVIPTKEEHVNVSKETEVVEEVEINKEVHEDTETVEETVRHEELDIEGKYNDQDRDVNDPTREGHVDRDRDNLRRNDANHNDLDYKEPNQDNLNR